MVRQLTQNNLIRGSGSFVVAVVEQRVAGYEAELGVRSKSAPASMYNGAASSLSPALYRALASSMRSFARA